MSRETPFPVEDKNDEHGTRKRTHNTTLGPESEHSRRHNTTLGSESELVAAALQEHSFTNHNTLVSKSEQPALVLFLKRDMHVMVCMVCGVDNCRSGYNRRLYMVCTLCGNHSVVDSLEDKKDDHSTRKRPYNTLGPDTDPESDHGPRKHPLNALGSESELVGEFEDNSTSAQKGNHSPNNSEVSDSRAESEQPGVLEKGYAMMCDVCGVENCRSGYNKPVAMVCYLCRSYGQHWPKNCPSGLYRGAPMPEHYGCFYWMNSNSTGA